ncbi:MAG TPA: aminotransferase class I/II-fold pyridoxal phosphate-dependent enzyme [Thermoanaerobaculia bacterium]|nr:aminotransferase class I/II-fold pyridoxal phosphate-dependent enzyme [Thermoanaerobaculia bacterium]
MSRIYLSPPHLSGHERELVAEAFDSNWIAPLGPMVDAFECELAQAVEVGHAAALSSGTAALHLALRLLGVGPGDEVLCPTLTFAGTAFPVVYEGARPVFVDVHPETWTLDPALLAEELERRSRAGRPPAAVVTVDLYGQSADQAPILAACATHGVPVVEDAAEALGASYRGRSVGGFGRFGVFSFNGNKVLTTSGGGALVSDDGEAIAHARKLASQAREPVVHYEHRELGFNYRLSNLLAAVGRGQLRVLGERVAARRRTFERYREALADLPGIGFMPEAPYGRSSRWLTCVTIDPAAAGVDREGVRLALEAADVEARPLWKPMHLQPVFAGCETVGGAVAEGLFERGLCLPSGSSLTDADRERVVERVRGAWGRR